MSIDKNFINNEELDRRIKILLPLCCGNLDDSGLTEMVARVAQENGISKRTVYRYLEAYRKNGVDGLIPMRNGRPGSRAIPSEILQQAIFLRRENPNRSVAKIIRCLELEGLIEPKSIKRSTLQDQLAKCDCSKEKIKVFIKSADAGGRRFQRKDRNSLWQSDGKKGPFIGKNKSLLISFIDDCTRYILHSQFYETESTESIMDCLRQAIKKCGVPNEVYFDNGAAYRSMALERTCTKLLIKKRHTKIFSAKSKGKIEKFHQIVDRFIEELNLDKVNNFDSLNKKWAAYLHAFYQTMEHGSLTEGASPLIAFSTHKKEIRYLNQDELNDAFLFLGYKRVVDKSGCVNFEGKKYTNKELILHIGKKVNIVWDPSDKSKIWIEIDKFPKLIAEPLVIKEWVPKDKGTENIFNPIIPTNKSRLIDAGEKLLKKTEAARIGALINTYSDMPDSTFKLNNSQNGQSQEQSKIPNSLENNNSLSPNNVDDIKSHREEQIVKLNFLSLNSEKQSILPEEKNEIPNQFKGISFNSKKIKETNDDN
jgi:transposase InsO family protein